MVQLGTVLGQGGVEELVLLCGLDHPSAAGQRRSVGRYGGGVEAETAATHRSSRS